MARGYGTDDQDERDEDEEAASRSQSVSSDEDEQGQTQNAQARKHAALFQPIASLCSALGGFEEFLDSDGNTITEYSLGDSVVGCLKDLKRFWRLDESDDDRTVARIFAQVGVLKNDLIHILDQTLGTGPKGDRIALACAELISALTWPINVAEELSDAAQLSTGSSQHKVDYTTLLNAQMGYKATLLHNGVLEKLVRLMRPCLEKSRRDRTEKDEDIISLVLHIFRNLAALRDRPASASQSANAVEQGTLQSEYICQLASSHIFDLFLAIAAQSDTSEYAPWNMLTLDIFHLLFRCVGVVELMKPADKIDTSRLDSLLAAESSSSRLKSRTTASRHSRFGTTIAFNDGDRKYIVHKQAASRGDGSATKILDDIKKTKYKKGRQNDDLAPPCTLKPDAVRCLYNVATAFIDSAFNPFFSSILRDIRLSRAKVRESDTQRFLFLSAYFLQFFLLLREDERSRGIKSDEEVVGGEGRGFGCIAEMTEVGSIGFVGRRMKLALEEKPPLWIELHAGIDCYTQILLVIDAMAASGVEDNTDVAEILQNKLYYEGEMLEMVVQVVNKYNGQSLKYLESVITLSHVLQRMLEKYSKSKAYMYVRKKRNNANRKKKQKQKRASGEDDEGDGLGQGEDDVVDEEEEMERGSLSYADHAFEFASFELKFADEGVLDTYMTYLEGWKSYRDPEQLKMITGLMHRQAIKSKCEGLFFKPTVLALFDSILLDPEIAPAKPRLKEHADLKALITWILRKFFKAASETPLFLLEIYFPKSRSTLTKMRIGEDPYSSADDKKKTSKDDGEVEVYEGFSLSQQIGIVVGALLEDGREYLLDIIKTELAIAAAGRTGIVLSIDGSPDDQVADGLDDSDEMLKLKAARLLAPSKEAIDLFTPYAVNFEDPRDKKAAATQSHFKLLMKLLKWEATPDPETINIFWSIPAALLPSVLSADIRMIDDFIADPLDSANGKSAKDLIQAKKKERVKKPRRAPVPEEETAGQKRKAKRIEEAAAYKSAQFVADSDDEEDAARDAIFFAAEAALRKSLGYVGAGKATAQQLKKVLKRKAVGEESSAIESDSDAGASRAKAKSKSKAKPKGKGRSKVGAPRPLERRSMSVDSMASEAEAYTREMEAAAKLSVVVAAEEEIDELEDDDTPISPATAPPPKRRRAVLDSDDE